MPKRPPKTPKERAFVKEYIKTKNATEAAARVYDVKDRDSARALGSETLAKLDIAGIMDDMGLTDERLIAILKEGLKATQTVRVKVISPKGNKEKDKESPDHPTRHKFLDTALKLKDKYPAEKHSHKVDRL